MTLFLSEFYYICNMAQFIRELQNELLIAGTKFEKQLFPGSVICNVKQKFSFKGVNVTPP
jgi:hypothetical protein